MCSGAVKQILFFFHTRHNEIQYSATHRAACRHIRTKNCDKTIFSFLVTQSDQVPRFGKKVRPNDNDYTYLIATSGLGAI